MAKGRSIWVVLDDGRPMGLLYGKRLRCYTSTGAWFASRKEAEKSRVMVRRQYLGCAKKERKSENAAVWRRLANTLNVMRLDPAVRDGE